MWQIGYRDSGHINFCVMTCISSLTVVMWLMLLLLYLEILLVLKTGKQLIMWTQGMRICWSEMPLEKSGFITGKHVKLFFIFITCEASDLTAYITYMCVQFVSLMYF